MHRRTLAAISVLGVLALTGCAGPSRDEVAERFAIELASDVGEPSDWAALAEDLAADALEGRCESETYRSGLQEGSPNLIYAWDVTCSTYFADDMTAEQLERAKQTLIDAVLTH